ncbi:MAG TPA: hypothetical protein VH575_25820 [Gemmataceae bacterium]|jgi:hypothetical protein
MRRLQLGLAMVALPVFALSLFVAGCGKDEKKSESDDVGDVKKDDKSAKTELKVMEPKGGVLKGKITVKSMPDVAADTKVIETGIAELKDQSQKDVCLMGSETEKTGQHFRVGDNKNLGNVFVWVKPDTGYFFKVDDKQLKEAKEKKVFLDQPHCAFIPHCAILFSEYHPDHKNPKKAERTGQTFEIHNSAPISHNTNYTGGGRNPSGNPIIPAGTNLDEAKVGHFKPQASEPVTFKCNIHGWMDAYLWVLDTPYYAISLSDTLDKANKVEKSDEKFGTYEIKNLPVGKVRVFAWHERGNWLTSNKGDVVEIKEGEPFVKDFEMEVK